MSLAERKMERGGGRQQSFGSLISLPNKGVGGGQGRCCLGDHRCAGSAHTHMNIKCLL